MARVGGLQEMGVKLARAARLAELKAQIESGRYGVSSRDLAECLMQSMLTGGSGSCAQIHRQLSS